MKKILILGAVLALLAVLVVPMAAFATDPTTPINGGYVAATFSITPPTAMTFNVFNPGVNTNVISNIGSVTVVNNSQAPTGWTVTAKDVSTQYGQMWDGGTYWLSIRLRIAFDSNAWQWANTGDSWASGPASGGFTLYARQDVVNTDPVAYYGITITFTGGLTF